MGFYYLQAELLFITLAALIPTHYNSFSDSHILY